MLAFGVTALQMRAWYTHQRLTPVQEGRRSSLFRRFSNSSLPGIRMAMLKQVSFLQNSARALNIEAQRWPGALRVRCDAQRKVLRGQVENIRLKAGNLRNRTRAIVTSEV